jgi:hypothetical protein
MCDVLCIGEMYNKNGSIYVPSSWTLISCGVVAFGIDSYLQLHPHRQTAPDLPVIAFLREDPVTVTDMTI